MNDLHNGLDNCGCCEGVAAATPMALDNPPGQPTLAYRVGNHGAFKASMLARLSQMPALRGFSTRDDDDPTIALIDGWATALDVLTFYQERIAVEGYLRTATERGSLLELARAIGYELRPGVAAGAHLAFDMETAAGAPAQARIPVGTRVQSVPGQDEKAQTYETVEEITARPQWNRLNLRLTQLPTLDASTDRVYLKTLTTQVQKGDALLFVGTARVTTASSQRWALRTVRDVQPDAPNDRTLVVLDRPFSAAEPTVSSADTPVVYLLRQRAALFGHNAPDWKAMSKEVRCMYDTPSCDEPPPAHATDWPGIGAIAGSVIDLDAVYPRVAPGSWLVLEKAGKTQLYLVKGVATPSVSKFALSAKVTRVSPDLTADLSAYGLRETTVYGQSEQVDLAEVAITSPLAAGVDTLTLAAATPDLPEGRQLLLAGLTPIGEQAGEIVQVKSVAGVVVTLEKPLLNSYERKSVVVYGNVAAATHGESRSEVLGSGDAGRVFQRFDLRNKPVTYRASDAASGSTSTLEVRVNSVAWQELPSFFERGRSDRIFITRLADDGATRVTFGDGVNGARLPAGVENITATYRVGSGLDGLVKPGQLSLLMTRPLGVKSVVNPLAPAGADDPETRDQARENAPITVLTFERIVSLADFENFARSFGGIAKAQAALLWQGEHRVVFVTVAGLQGAALPAGDPLLERLRSAIRKAGAVLVPFDLLSYESLSFALRAEIIPVEGFLTNEVMAAAQAAVQSAFSFEQRSLGQSVTRSEVIAAIQSAPGVQAVNLKAFHFTGDSPVADRGQAAPVAQRLIALPTRRSEETATVLPVQLIVVDPAQIELEPVTVFGK